MEGEHIALSHWPANIALQHNPRAMDILNFFTYRLRKPLTRPVLLHASVLHAMFGRDVKNCVISGRGSALKLYDSPPLIPYRKMLQIG